MPRKVFTAGEVLAAADVNEFLMDQTVQTFASSAARGSAIGTAVEGMVTWLNDENALQVYDGTQWNGLAASGGNAIINGAFELNQRAFTSTTGNNVYTFDRWASRAAGDGTSTFTAQTFTPGSAPIAGYEGTSYIDIASTGQTLTTSRTALAQQIEGVRNFAGQTVTVSFFAKAASGTPSIAVYFEQVFGTGGSPSAYVLIPGQKTAITSSWARYSFTFAIPSIAGKTLGTSNDRLSLFITTSAGSTLNTETNSLGIQTTTISLWGIQLEAGPTANVFRRNANSLAGELAACQRYYFRTTSPGSFSTLGFGLCNSTTQGKIRVSFPVEMRTRPTALEQSGTAGDYAVTTANGSGQGLTVVPSFSSSTSTGADVNYTVGSGLVAGNATRLLDGNTTAAFLAWSAEL